MSADLRQMTPEEYKKCKLEEGLLQRGKQEKMDKLLKYTKAEERFEFESCSNSSLFYGTIIFRHDEFLRCTFRGVSDPYSLEDWAFLGELSKLINELQQNYLQESTK